MFQFYENEKIPPIFYRWEEKRNDGAAFWPYRRFLGALRAVFLAKIPNRRKKSDRWGDLRSERCKQIL